MISCKVAMREVARKHSGYFKSNTPWTGSSHRHHTCGAGVEQIHRDGARCRFISSPRGDYAYDPAKCTVYEDTI